MKRSSKIHPSLKRWLPCKCTCKTLRGQIRAAKANFRASTVHRFRYWDLLRDLRELVDGLNCDNTVRATLLNPHSSQCASRLIGQCPQAERINQLRAYLPASWKTGGVQGWPRAFTPAEAARRRWNHDARFRRDETQRILTEICSNLNFNAQLTSQYPLGGTLTVKLPTLPVQASTVEEHGGRIKRIGKDWDVVADYRTWLNRSEGHTTWKNGRPVEYTRATCTNHVRCFADARRAHRITLHFLEAKLVRVAPAGYRWNVDANGLRLIRPDGADYHPHAEELLRPDWNACCVQQLEANATRRLEQLKNDRALATATERGVRVGLADSLAAGNCHAGTLSFCQRHGLHPNRWYSPNDLLRLANGDAQRVRITIGVAVRRHDALANCGAEVFYPTGSSNQFTT